MIHTTLEWCLRSTRKTIVLVNWHICNVLLAQTHKMGGNRVNSLQKQIVHEKLKGAGKVTDDKYTSQKDIHKPITNHSQARKR